LLKRNNDKSRSATQLETQKPAKQSFRWLLKIFKLLLVDGGRVQTLNLRISILQQSGVSTEFISEALGHANFKTTQSHLAGFENESKKETVKVLTAFKNPQEEPLIFLVLLRSPLMAMLVSKHLSLTITVHDEQHGDVLIMFKIVHLACPHCIHARLILT